MGLSPLIPMKIVICCKEKYKQRSIRAVFGLYLVPGQCQISKVSGDCAPWTPTRVLPRTYLGAYSWVGQWWPVRSGSILWLLRYLSLINTHHNPDYTIKLFENLKKVVKVVVLAEILPRDFLQTLGNHYWWLTFAKIHRLKKFHH